MGFDPKLSIDIAHLERQREWSIEVFGPGRRTLGIIHHIRSELVEIAEHPTDLYEWVDVVILALDGAWRAGHEPLAIIEAIKNKQERNEARIWPDWRELSEDVAIEHDHNVHDLGCDGDHHLEAACNSKED